MAQRLFLNVAYKRVEPLYGLLGRPTPVGRLRPLFNWYARRYPGPRSVATEQRLLWAAARGKPNT